MSSNLYFKPVVKNNGTVLPDQLKYALKKLDVFNCNTLDSNFDADFIPILRGMEAAGVDGARELIDAIEKYIEVEVKEVF